MKFAGLILMSVLSGAASAADPAVTAKITPAEVSLGEPARLTVTVSGDSQPSLAPPQIPGLDFTQVGQSRRIEAVNGVVTSTVSIIYRVMAQKAGTYVIADAAPGAAPVVLHVVAAASAQADKSAEANAAAGAAFVRLVVPAHELYVGQSVPVEIEVGTRDGVVSSLNGLPTLKGDAFTLDKLAAEPQRRSQEIIDGKPFTVFGWHGVLAAIKPGPLSLSVETPLTVRLPSQRPATRFLDESALEDVFGDPIFQGFFGATVQKDITVASPAMNFNVLELPVEGRPSDFSGAVGSFQISSELKDRKVVAGDPATLRITVSGEGNFDRVTGAMLTDSTQWKTYEPTTQFKSADGTDYRGQKTFEQPVVAIAAGRLTLPALAFSYFDPIARRYVTAHSEPLSVDVAAPAGQPAGLPAAAPASVGSAPSTAAEAGQPGAVAAPTSGVPRGGLRPDHALRGNTRAELVPYYYQPCYALSVAALVSAFAGTWLWLLARTRPSARGRSPRDVARGLEPQQLLAELNRASAAGNVEGFFQTAREALQRVFAMRWQIPPDAVTIAEIDARLGVDSDVRRLFMVADEARYAGHPVQRAELERWKKIVIGQLQPMTAA